jgi:hypothetical protein
MNNKKTITKKTIRQIVREEVAMAIQEVITELKQPTQIMTGATGEIRRNNTPKKKIVEKQNYTNNSVLNDVLNETANDDSEWKTMGGTQYTTERMNELVGGQYSDMMNDNPNGTLANEMGVNPNEAPDFLKKDYRAVMKAIDKKQGK